MGDAILVFIITAVASFVGSLQPGPVNLAVIHTTLTRGYRDAMKVASAGVIPELIYSAIAAVFFTFLVAHPKLKLIFGIITVLFLLSAGTYLILHKPVKKNETQSVHHSGKLYSMGFFSGLFNPLLLIYWFTYLNFVSLSGKVIIRTTTETAAFVIGTASGAFILLWITATLAMKKREFLMRLLGGNLDKVTGYIFVALGIWSIIRLLAE